MSLILTTTKIKVLTVIIIALVLFIWFFKPFNRPAITKPIDLNRGHETTMDMRKNGQAESELSDLSSVVSTAGSQQRSDKEIFIDTLRNKFGATIHNRHSQVKAIEKLVGFLKQTYPERWLDHLRAYLDEIFPDRAEELFALYEGMSLYNQWFEAEQQNLKAMTAEQRRQLIWDMRYSFFGDAAKEIWAESLKGERVERVLSSINSEENELAFSEKHTLYIDVLSEAYGERLPTMLENRRQEVSDRFLSLKQVQHQLGKMKVEERRESLNQFRRALGMDEPAIQRWNELDQERDQRRIIVAQYAREKQAIQDRGDEYPLMLIALQDRLFGLEAEIIRNEEAGGYFRYEHAQIFGQN